MKTKIRIPQIKYLWTVLFLFALAGCNQGGQDEDAIRKQINAYQKEVNDINQKIAELEQQLTGANNESATYGIPVKLKKIESEEFNHFFNVRGSVEAINESFISPEISGRLTSIDVVEGEQVRKGQILARLDSEITQNSISELQAQLDYAEIVYQKQERLWEKKIGSELQYLNAKNNRDNLLNRLETLKTQRAMADITSPIDGVVDDISMKIGEIAMPGRELMRVVNLEELYVNADVSESYLASIKKNDVVNLSFPVYPDIQMDVPVFRIGNVIDPGNRTFRLQLKINNLDEQLKPNILAIIRINDFSTESTIVVPSKIIKQDMTGYYLYVVYEEDNILKSQKVYIQTGMSQNDYTMVTSGLSLGDRVIVEGYNQVSNGSVVSIK